MVTLSRDYLYELWKEITTRIPKSKLNKKFGRSDEPAYISYLLMYFAKREYQDLYTDMCGEMTQEEKEELKNWAINYLSICDKKEMINWAINYLSADMPIMLLDEPSNPTKGKVIFRGIQRDIIFSSKDKNVSQMQHNTEITQSFKKIIEDVEGKLKRLNQKN